MESAESHPIENQMPEAPKDDQRQSQDFENRPATQMEHMNNVTGDVAIPPANKDNVPEIHQSNASSFYSDVQSQPPLESSSSIQITSESQEQAKPSEESAQTQESTPSIPTEYTPQEGAVSVQPTPEQVSSIIPTAETVQPSDEEIDRKVTEEQLKYCDTVLKTLKKHRDAGPFLIPVDPIALGIPDYPMIIKTPMDLSTVERKLLQTKEYKSADEFIGDVKLMLNNCYTYNPPETVVYKRGKNLEKQLENSLKKMPSKESYLASLHAQPTPSAQQDKKRKASTAGVSGPTSLPSAPGSKQRAVAQTGSPSTGGETPKPRRAASIKQGSKSFTEEMKSCMNVWKEVTKKANIVWPFMQPVDPVALGIPDYFTIIKEPMDFGSIRKKIESGAYSGFSDFEHDVRLIFSNCYLYNAPESDVVALCKQVEALFDSKLASALPKSKSFAAHEESADESGDDSDSETLKVLKQQLAQIKSQISAITQKRKSKKAATTPHLPTPGAGVAAPGKPHKEKGAAMTALPKKEKKVPVLDEVTYDEKQQLSYDIGFLPPDLLSGVVEIIQECLPSIRNGSEEIELDMDLLDTKTIRKLQAFVQRHRPQNVPKAPQHPAVSSTSEESDSD